MLRAALALAAAAASRLTAGPTDPMKNIIPTLVVAASAALPAAAFAVAQSQSPSAAATIPAEGAVPWAQRGDDHFTPAWHAARRAALVERLRARAKRAEKPDKDAKDKKDAAAPDKSPTKAGVVVLRGAPPRRDYQRFRQTNEFFYLTGVEAPGAALVIDVESGKEALFLEPMEFGEGIWTDLRPHAPHKIKKDPAQKKEDAAAQETPQAAMRKEVEALTSKLGFADVRESSDLDAHLDSLQSRGVFWTMLAPEEYEATSRDDAESFEAKQAADPWDGRLSRNHQFAEKLKKEYKVDVKDLTPHLDRLRRVKLPEEIAAMRRASEIAAAGHVAAMRATRPGVKEWQIAGEATALFYRLGAPSISYFPIVGTGRNALILHYTDVGATVNADDVVLMDYAPEWRYYASDVTRSWPASGKFGDKARKIYEAVLAAQEAGIAAVKPGIAFAEVNRAAAEAMRAAGFDPNKYMPHGLSHPIGMTTHDVGGLGKLEPGMVFTVEPGIYDHESGIGVRIEDVVAVTDSGADVLSKDAPKRVADIEALVGRSAR